MHLVLVGARLAHNLGGPSILLAVRDLWRRHCVDLRLTMLHTNGATLEPEEEDAARSCGVRQEAFGDLAHLGSLLSFLAALLLYRFTRRWVGRASGERLVRLLESADGVVNVWGIGFSDKQAPPNWLLAFLYRPVYLAGKLLGKPVIKYCASFGPCERTPTRIAAKLYLGCLCDLIVCRERESYDHLQRLSIRTPMLVCPDTAFVMPSQGSDLSERMRAVQAVRPVVGLSVSFQVEHRWTGKPGYVDTLTGVVRRLLEDGMHVLLIPNQVSRAEGRDDGAVACALQSRFADHPHVQMLDTRLLTASQIKGVIGACDAVIASRYHSIVAAVSQGVPVVAIGWHHKYREILEAVGLERYALSAEQACEGAILDTFGHLWKERHALRRTILDRLTAIERRIDEGARRLWSLLGRSQALL